MSKFPIKYAIQEVYEYNNHNYNNNLYGYIVSKCYVIKEVEKRENGNLKKYYEVVFPYTNKNSFLHLNNIDENLKDQYLYRLRKQPEYSKINDNIINAQLVDNIYNTLEEAQLSKIEKSKDLLKEKLDYCLLKDRKKMYIKFRQDIESLTDFENLVSKYTEDLNITKGKVKNRKK